MTTHSEIYAQITGQKSGVIQGPVIQKGREGSIQVLALTHDSSAAVQGAQQRESLQFTKAFDKATVPLQLVLWSREELTTCTFDFWSPLKAVGGVGQTQDVMRIILTNATVSSISHYTALPDQFNQFNTDLLEDITIAYSRIEVVWLDGNLNATHSAVSGG